MITAAIISYLLLVYPSYRYLIRDNVLGPCPFEGGEWWFMLLFMPLGAAVVGIKNWMDR
jgi:hypothetical protein